MKHLLLTAVAVICFITGASAQFVQGTQALFSRDKAGECCSGGNYTLALAENTAGTGRRAGISFHNAGFDEGKLELSRDAGFRSIKFYDNQGLSLGIHVVGQALFSRDNAAECCGGVAKYTIAIAENTAVSGRRASISFHNSGSDEGRIELSNDGGFRNIKFADNQGANLGLNVTGKVLIGNTTMPAGYKLYVEQGIITEKIKVALKTSANWADHVFAPGYKLQSLPEVELFIKQNKHLPDVPSAETLVKDGGVDITEMLAKQMAKIEELTLYMIDMNKRMAALEKENAALKQKTVISKNQ
jgi:opacity protein-like surface antigen